MLLLYILESASGFSNMPHMQKKRIVLRCPGPFTDAPEGDDQERKDWMTFLFRAHEMTEEDVAAQIKTPAVLEAFELAKLSALPDDVRTAYEAQVREGDSYLSKGGSDRKVRKGDKRAKKDWITFFQRAHEMTEEDVAAQIKTPAVLRAFEFAKLSTLPDDVRAAYEAEVREHDRYAQHTAELIRTAKIEVARKLLAMNLTVDQIEKATGLSSEDIKRIK